MAVITINYQVFMTHCHVVPATTTIGTDGLGPCIGIIAVRTDGQIFCAHLSCSIAGTPGNQQIITSKAAEVILANLGEKAAVNNVYCATSSLKDKSAKWMLDGIIASYSKVSYSEGTAIYWNGTNPVVTQSTLNGTTKGDQSDNGPIDVK